MEPVLPVVTLPIPSLDSEAYQDSEQLSALNAESPAAESPTVAPKDSKNRLLHLDGARAGAALWIVCHHMAPREPSSSLDPFVMRVDVAVEFFMLLSGFLAHHLHAEEALTSSTGSLLRFYCNRFSRVVATTYVSTALCIVALQMGGFRPFTWRTATCMLFVKTWIDPWPNCPNMPTWFVAALLPSWLLYPIITAKVLNKLERIENSWKNLCILGLCCWLAVLGPQVVVMIWNGSWLTWRQVTYTWFWPPAQLPAFALGACVASLVRIRPPSRKVGVLGDAAVVLILVICFAVPVPVPSKRDGPDQWRPGHYVQWEQVLPRLALPLLAAWMYGSFSGGSLISRLMAHPVPSGLGAYTMEVYLFQMPLHDVALWLRAPNSNWLWRGLPWVPEVFLFYVLVLWLLSGLFSECVAKPAVQRLRRASDSWEGVPLQQLLWGCRRYRPVALEVR